MTYNADISVMRLPRNSRGRDFVVGDIHGHFEMFDHILKEIEFDPSKDRMLSVGDGIDRGPESERVLEYWNQPWFYAVRGNHEAMLMAAQDNYSTIYDLWMHNGGLWSEHVPSALLKEMADCFSQLPYVIEVETAHGNVGIVHADLPTDYSWSSLVKDLENGDLKERDVQTLLWSRELFRKYRMSAEYPGAFGDPSIKDIHRIYLGHSIVEKPTLFGNVMFIDTGAYCNGKLTVVDLANEECIILESNSDHR